ncbi:hypothetical protein [Pseudoalteromonas sp.]|uniref:hypothetical protein n=1 Tax=Pseudoalteromonas sp. TaxID=53249 RepID=UPI003565AACE
MLKNKLIWTLTALMGILQFGLINLDTKHFTLTIYTFSPNSLVFPLPDWLSMILIPSFVCVALLIMKMEFNRYTYKRAQTTLTLIGFVLSFNYGASISGCVYLGFLNYANLLFFVVVFIAPLIKIYRAECMLGFTLGLSFIFGTLSAIIYTSVLAGICFVIYTLRKITLTYYSGGPKHTENTIN